MEWSIFWPARLLEPPRFLSLLVKLMSPTNWSATMPCRNTGWMDYSRLRAECKPSRPRINGKQLYPGGCEWVRHDDLLGGVRQRRHRHSAATGRGQRRAHGGFAFTCT